jgi:hypothetical protein
MEVKVTISKGNSKIGKIPNVSLVPVKDCGNCESCKKGCYALKSYRMYPSVRNAWNANSDTARNNPIEYWNTIFTYLEKHKPKLFRYHVAGDILNQEYLNNMIYIANSFPGTQFLAFTKMHHLDFSNKPNNLSIVLSMFPKMIVPDSKLPKAWLQDGTEDRIPDTAQQCAGNCNNCGICWYLGNGKDVYFIKH